MKKIINRIIGVCCLILFIFSCFGFICGKQFYDKEGGIWISENPYMELDFINEIGKLQFGEINYTIGGAPSFDGATIEVYDISNIKDNILCEEDLLLKADTYYMGNDLTLTITEDNLTSDNSWLGKKIVLTFTPTEE